MNSPPIILSWRVQKYNNILGMAPLIWRSKPGQTSAWFSSRWWLSLGRRVEAVVESGQEGKGSRYCLNGGLCRWLQGCVRFVIILRWCKTIGVCLYVCMVYIHKCLLKNRNCFYSVSIGEPGNLHLQQAFWWPPAKGNGDNRDVQ